MGFTARHGKYYPSPPCLSHKIYSLYQTSVQGVKKIRTPMKTVRFPELETKFPWCQWSKSKKGIFAGSQIKELARDNASGTALNDSGRINSVCSGSHRSPNNSELAKQLLDAYRELGCGMSIEMHVLHPHLGFIAGSGGELQFHIKTSTVEKWNPNTLRTYQRSQGHHLKTWIKKVQISI